MKKVFNVALIGAGNIGRLHGENIFHHIPNLTIKTLSEVHSSPAIQQWAAKLHIQDVISDYNLALNDPEIDIVFICSSTDTHADIIDAAIAAEKHVFCEKPISLSIKRALSCKKNVLASARKFHIGFNRRFDHNFKHMHEKIHSGAIGQLRMLHIISRDPSLAHASYVKVSGSMFYDMTIHDFDMLRYLAQTEVTEIHTYAASLVNPITAKYNDCDSAIISCKLANGGLAVIENIRETAYGYDQRAEVLGSLGMLHCTNDYPSTVTHFTPTGRNAANPYYFYLERYNQSYIDEVLAFMRSIVEDQPAAIGVEDGIQPLYMAEAARRSFKQQTAIKLADIVSEFEP